MSALARETRARLTVHREPGHTIRNDRFLKHDRCAFHDSAGERGGFYTIEKEVEGKTRPKVCHYPFFCERKGSDYLGKLQREVERVFVITFFGLLACYFILRFALVQRIF